MQMKIFAIGWFLLAFSVIVLAIYRRVVARGEDDYLHVRETDGPAIAHQAVVAARLDVIDKWGKWLTAIAFVLGIALAFDYVLQVWRTGFQLLP